MQFMPGTSVTLTAKTGGTAPLNYQWQLDTGSGPKNIPGATNAAYTFVTTTSAQGTYYLVVTSAHGSATSPGASLTVAPASVPVLMADTTPPGAQSPLGGLVTFQAAYQGTLPITYQWQFDQGQGFTDLPGATNNVLTLMNLQPTNAGSYRLTAVNSVGQGQASTAATLMVSTNATLAVFTGPDPGQGLDLDGNFVLAQYYGGSDAGPLEIGDAVFFFSQTPGGASYLGAGGNFGSTLAEQNLSRVCGGVLYASTVDWMLDTNTVAGHNYRLQLLFHEVYFNGGGARVFGVNINGTDLVTNLDSAAMGAYLTEPKGVVVTYDFPGDGGAPIIIMTASVNLAAVNGLTLEDLSEPAAPTVVSPPQSETVYAGKQVQFTAAVGGSSPRHYQWQAGANGVFTNLVDGGRISGATNASLTIAAATLLDAAQYRVIVSNAVGVATSSPAAILEVLPIPAHQLINVGVQSSLSGPAVLGQLPDYWNVVAGNSTTSTNLLDVTGAATGVGISIQV